MGVAGGRCCRGGKGLGEKGEWPLLASTPKAALVIVGVNVIIRG